jgi:hypothetical protein
MTNLSQQAHFPSKKAQGLKPGCWLGLNGPTKSRALIQNVRAATPERLRWAGFPTSVVVDHFQRLNLSYVTVYNAIAMTDAIWKSSYEIEIAKIKSSKRQGIRPYCAVSNMGSYSAFPSSFGSTL